WYLGSSMLRAPGIACFLARADGRAVSSSLAIEIDRSVGVFGVATLPDARGRCSASAITAAAVDWARDRADLAWLQASKEGRPVYERMGFRAVADWDVWLLPPGASGSGVPEGHRGYRSPMQSREGTRTLAGRYELTEEIARGGMGVVWRGEDTLLGRAVGVKKMPPPASADSGERAQKRVLREARAAAALHHPGIVTVYDMLEEDGASFIVMELLDAESLHDEVAANGPLDEQRVIDVGR